MSMFFVLFKLKVLLAMPTAHIRCVLTTDAKSAFQSASRSNCYKFLCTEDTLRIVWPAANMTLRPSSGFTQGDVNTVNSSKLFTCNTASLVHQDAAKTDATVVAIVDDITIMGTLAAVVLVE